MAHIKANMSPKAAQLKVPNFVCEVLVCFEIMRIIAECYFKLCNLLIVEEISIYAESCGRWKKF